MAKANFTCVPSIQPIHQISRQHSSPRPPPVELEFSRHQRNVGPPDGVVGPERHYIKISLSPRIFKRIWSPLLYRRLSMWVAFQIWNVLNLSYIRHRSGKLCRISNIKIRKISKSALDKLNSCWTWLTSVIPKCFLCEFMTEILNRWPLGSVNFNSRFTFHKYGRLNRRFMSVQASSNPSCPWKFWFLSLRKPGQKKVPKFDFKRGLHIGQRTFYAMLSKNDTPKRIIDNTTFQKNFPSPISSADLLPPMLTPPPQILAPNGVA